MTPDPRCPACGHQFGRTCADCGMAFFLDAAEEAWFLAKGFKLPRRCPDCRSAKRRARAYREQAVTT